MRRKTSSRLRPMSLLHDRRAEGRERQRGGWKEHAAVRQGRGNSAVGSEVAVQMMFAVDIDFPSHSKAFIG